MKTSKSPILKALELLSLIRYQVASPSETTMGGCPDKCRGSSRSTCINCLTEELGLLVGKGLAFEYIDAIERSTLLQNRILEKASKHAKQDTLAY